jgi:acetyl-CoA acetyltransferase
VDAAVVGVARTPFWRRGESEPRTGDELACDVILAALADARLQPEDLDGFVYYGLTRDTALLAQTLGLPDVRFTVASTGGGGGSAGALGIAAAAIASGLASTVVCLRVLQQGRRRLGAAFAPSTPGANVGAEADFYLTSGLISPGQMFAMMARRHMHRYGTRREHLGEIVLTHRAHARTRPDALRTRQLTMDEYLDTPFISAPLCRYDFCVENDAAGAVVVTSLERARDLAQWPVRIAASESGGSGRWGQAETWLGMPDDLFTSSGHGQIAGRLYGRAGVSPADVDVALVYDNFSSNVLMQLEDYGFCGRGEGGDFVASGAIRWPSGALPVNPHGGQLAEGFIAGMTHIIEAVEQLRGTAVNQVAGAEVALVTGGAAAVPVSGAVLTR